MSLPSPSLHAGSLQDARQKQAQRLTAWCILRREQKSHDEGGRRRQQWWLVDDNSHEHLAVVGEERDPRDGHYNYYAEKPFSLISPLACQNRTKVHEYLESVRAV